MLSSCWRSPPMSRRPATARRLRSPTRRWRSSTGICGARGRRLCRGAAAERRRCAGRTRTCTCSRACLPCGNARAGRRYLARTTELFDLFATRFFRDPGVLGEYFTAALRPADGVVGRIVEPGHHYEWVWLLRRFEQASGRSVQSYVDALYGHADRYGFDEAGTDRRRAAGRRHARAGVRRIWPITEAIKANLVEARLGRTQGEGRAAALAVRAARSLPDGRSARRLARQARSQRLLRERVHACQHALSPAGRDRRTQPVRRPTALVAIPPQRSWGGGPIGPEGS